jgi:hypothetical protein
MPELKTLLQLTNEAIVRDTPFIDTIKADLVSAIDNVMLLETEYYVEYDINTTVSTADGPLQKTRIKNYILDMLKTKGYRADLRQISSVEKLVVTWTISSLSIS